MILAAILAPVITVVVIVIAFAGEMLVFRYLKGSGSVARESSGVLGVLAALAGLLIPILLGLIAGLLVRGMWLRASIRKELVRSTCPKCDYQLLGLPTSAGVVRCPECGLDTDLGVAMLPSVGAT
jgi:hypothetical protein